MTEVNPYILPEHPAASDELDIELYSQQHIDSTIKQQFSSTLTKTIIFP